ncbi:MAG: hypothetical protein ACLUS6_04440 [Dysosmobacter sp.]
MNAIASGQVDLGLCTPPSYYAFQEEGTALAVATFYPEDVETKFGTVKCMANWDIDAVFGGMDCLAIRSDAPQGRHRQAERHAGRGLRRQRVHRLSEGDGLQPVGRQG